MLDVVAEELLVLYESATKTILRVALASSQAIKLALVASTPPVKDISLCVTLFHLSVVPL